MCILTGRGRLKGYLKTDLGTSKTLSDRGRILPKVWPSQTNRREIPGGSWMSEQSDSYSGPKEERGPL